MGVCTTQSSWESLCSSRILKGSNRCNQRAQLRCQLARQFKEFTFFNCVFAFVSFNSTFYCHNLILLVYSRAVAGSNHARGQG
jgi:hypothetical protein